MTLTISGLIAHCKSCQCKFMWHLENAPFVDSEIIGTCEKCLNDETHKCVDESTIPTITGIYPEVLDQ